MTEPHIAPLWPDDEFIGSAGGPMFEMADGKRYVIASSLVVTSPNVTQEARVPITRFIQETGGLGALPVPITTYNIDEIISRAPIPTKEKSWRLLNEIVPELRRKPGRMRWELSPQVPGYLDRLRRIGADLDDELRALLDYLEFAGYISLNKTLGPVIDIEMGAAGLIQYESEFDENGSSNAFVAMWFNDQMTEAFESAIVPAVERWGYTPVRIDRREYNNKIDDEIISEIRRAKFVIADFSCGEDGARGGVYYEAGFAAGLGKPVIFTVRQANLNQVHFDTRQFNHIVWDTLDDLKSGPENRIGATIGERKS